MVIEGVAIGVLLVMRLFPKIPAARLLHHAFVEQPAAWTRRHVIFACVLLGLLFSGNQFIMLAGMDFAMLLAWDSALAIDAAIAAWTAASLSRFGEIRNQVLTRWRAVRARGARSRSVRSRVRATRRDIANDDEPALAALAA